MYTNFFPLFFFLFYFIEFRHRVVLFTHTFSLLKHLFDLKFDVTIISLYIMTKIDIMKLNITFNLKKKKRKPHPSKSLFNLKQKKKKNPNAQNFQLLL